MLEAVQLHGGYSGTENNNANWYARRNESNNIPEASNLEIILLLQAGFQMLTKKKNSQMTRNIKEIVLLSAMVK